MIASPDGLGFSSPRIVAVVKHRKDSMGAPQIRAFVGDCALVTMAFTLVLAASHGKPSTKRCARAFRSRFLILMISRRWL